MSNLEKLESWLTENNFHFSKIGNELIVTNLFGKVMRTHPIRIEYINISNDYRHYVRIIKQRFNIGGEQHA